HVKILGDTLPKIAAEKAGIIKPHTPVVLGEMGSTEVTQVFIDKAKSVNAPLVFAQLYMNNFEAEREEGRWLFHADGYPGLQSELTGSAQDKNARTVLTAVEVLLETGYKIPKEAVYRGFANVIESTGLTGRWHQLQSSPRIICDIAHNAHGIQQVVEQLQSERYKRLHIVFGMANDKDADAMLALLPRNAIYYFTRAVIDRALDETELAKKASMHGLQGLTYPTVARALEAARKNADKDDLVFIGGSSFIVADALPLFQ
ncbi:MAG: cyanophycin synthetase, partial [Proteiniphilum sp.]